MKRSDYERKLLKADGTVTDYPPAGRTYTLEELQRAVGGYVQIVSIPGGKHMLVLNEEGKLKGLAYNDLATRLYGNPSDVVVGDVLFCKSDDVE